MSKTPATILSFAFLAIAGRWLVGIIIGALVVSGITIYAISFSIKTDCQNVYERNLEISNRWITIQAGSTESGCPANPNEDLE